jgi:hypothetical protein
MKESDYVDVEKVDKNGVRWVTEGYLYTSKVIAKDDERKEIIGLLNEGITTCDFQIKEFEHLGSINSIWVQRKKAYEIAIALIKRRGVD